jgi:hypothetical protein
MTILMKKNLVSKNEKVLKFPKNILTKHLSF